MSDRTETYDIDPGSHVLVSLHAGDVRFKEGADPVVVIAMTGSSDALDMIDVDATSESVAVTSTVGKRRSFGTGSVDLTFTLPSGCDITVRLGAGDALVSVAVNDLEVSTGAGDVRVEEVTGTADIEVGSGDIRVGSVAGNARISSANGDIRLESVSEIVASTAAGDVLLGDVSEIARIKSATGDVRVRHCCCTDLEVKTMSGDVDIALVPGMIVNASIKTMSGELRNRVKPSSVEKTTTLNLDVTSLSGDVTLRTAK